MRIRRDLVTRSAVGAAAVLTAALAVAGAWWLPGRADDLRTEAARLGQDLSAATSDRPAVVPDGTVPLPGAGALPARAAAVVDAVRRQGVDPVHYELGARTRRDDLTSQALTVFFEAGFPVVARVLAELAAQAPAVAIQRVDLERGEGETLEVAVHVDLLGGPAPLPVGGR